MISIFPLWTFHLYVATFQQHLHMEYISLSWYDIPELMVPITISLIEDCCYQGSYWTKRSSWLSWSRHFESFTVATMTWLTVMEYLCQKWTRICSTCRKHFLVLSSWQVPLVEQKLLTRPEHLSSPPVFSGVRVSRSVVLCVCFVDRCLSFCTFTFCHSVVCSSIYGFWLPLWYLQTLLISY
jgi:hypothetical protein